jgi:alpha-galactosidase
MIRRELMKNPVIVVIGAASTTFGPKILRDIINHPELGGSTLRYVDINKERLDIFTRLSKRILGKVKHRVGIEAFTDRKKALKGADYVLISIETSHYDLWKQDFKIPVSMGVRQVTGELGGPGGLFHAMRQIPIHLEIARDIEKLCPGAVVMVMSNPLNRICLAMRRYSGVGQIIGLCHGVEIVQCFFGQILGYETKELLATAAGVNHFTWILDLRLQDTGEDLYPLLREKFKKYNPKVHALSRKLFDIYGYFPSCGDEHIGEYLPFAWEYLGLSGPPLEDRHENEKSRWKYFDMLARRDKNAGKFLKENKREAVELKLQDFYSPRSWVDTLAFPVINAVHTNKLIRMPALNMVNEGTINNLPQDIFVEVPASVDSSGIRPLQIGSLPKPLASFCRRDIDQMELIVEAAVKGDKNLVLQAMMLDPVVDSIKTAEKVFSRMMKLQAKYLPQFK